MHVNYFQFRIEPSCQCLNLHPTKCRNVTEAQKTCEAACAMRQCQRGRRNGGSCWPG